MRKLLSILSLTLVFAVLFTACSAAPSSSQTPSESEVSSAPTSEPESESETSTPDTKPVVNLAGLTGPTTMGMVQLLEENEVANADNVYNFTLAGTADEITPKLIQGELDIAAVPANLASTLYNNTEGEIVTIAINTLGVLYMTEVGDSITSVEDLKGKTIIATGKGTTPEYTLRYILTENGIDPDVDVTLEWKSEATEIVAHLQESSEGVVALLPQPFATVAQTQVEGLNIALDMTEEWNKLENGSQLVTGVYVARKDFIENNPEALANFFADYEESAAFVNENPSDAAVMVEKVGITSAAVAEKAIPLASITDLTGEDMKAALSGYLQVLFDQNPQAIGGTMPADDFYYEK